MFLAKYDSAVNGHPVIRGMERQENIEQTTSNSFELPLAPDMTPRMIRSPRPGPVSPVKWIVSDVAALLVGLRGNVEGLLKLDPRAIIPRYGPFGGRDWPSKNTDLEDRMSISPLDTVFACHDELYRYHVEIEEPTMTFTEADRRLMSDMWSLKLDEQPGPIGQVYRAFAAAAFGLKQTTWNRGQ